MLDQHIAMSAEKLLVVWLVMVYPVKSANVKFTRNVPPKL